MTEPAYRISCEPSQPPARIVASGSKAEFYSDLRKRTGATAFMVDAQGNRTPVGATSQAPTVAAVAKEAPSPTQDAAALRSEAREYAGLSTGEREALWRTNPAKVRISGDGGHLDRRIADTRIGGWRTPRSASRTAGSAMADS